MTAGLLFVSLSVAFKVQPVLGLALLLISLVFIDFQKNKRNEIIRHVSVVVGVGVFLGAIPILLIPDAFSSFFLYDAAHIQYYFLNAFTGLVDLLLNFFPASTGTILWIADIGWWLGGISLVALLLKHLSKEQFLPYADPIDILSLGIIVWLIILKQTQPYYVLWALVPLLAKGRTRSVLYVLAGSFFGSLLFRLAYVYGIPPNYVGVPSIDSSLAFLIGGAILTFFLILAMLDLLQETKKVKMTEIVAV